MDQIALQPDALAGSVIPASLTIQPFRVRAVDAPLSRPHPTAGGNLTSAPLVLLDLQTREGIVGRACVFCYAAMALAPVAKPTEALGEMLAGRAVAPVAIERALRRRGLFHDRHQ